MRWIAAVFVISGCGLVLDLDPPDQPLDASIDSGTGGGCAGAEDGTECGDGRRCLDEVCAPPLCGDGFLDSGEECDDGNAIPGDGCGADCTRVACTEDTECGISNGCQSAACIDRTCAVTTQPEGSTCSEGGRDGRCIGGTCVSSTCGDGLLDPGELCDAGDADPNDGCEPDCTPTCSADGDCQDEISCNGSERCQTLGPQNGARCEPGPMPTVPACFECRSDTGTFELIDRDGDGYAAGSCPGVGGDCNDMDPTRNPGASDPISNDDGIDQNCDGLADNQLTVDCQHDTDGDGFGAGEPTGPMTACDGDMVPVRYDSSGGIVSDCAPDDADVYPGQLAFFDVPYCADVASICFDYDCSGTLEARWPRVLNCRTPFGSACSGEGFVDVVPACGAVGAFAMCVMDGFRGCTVGTRTMRRQECH